MSTVSSSFIYIGNFADIDPDETNTTNENPGVIFQTFDFSQMSFVSVDQTDDDEDGFVQSDDNGQSPDTFTYDVGNGSVTSGLDNAARYNVSYVNENGDTLTTTISAYQTQSGDVFLKFPPDLEIKSVTIESVQQDDFSAITHGTSSNSTPVCFAAGTLIGTPLGARKVEDLRIGDLVVTLDRGLQPILWIQTDLQHLDQSVDANKPVQIAAGALGTCRPSMRLIVSPMHRILVGGRSQFAKRFEGEALAPAKALTEQHGIRHMNGKAQIKWVHFACARHEIVFANGCLAETLLLGPMVLQCLSPIQVRSAIDTFCKSGGPLGPLNGKPARPCLRTSHVRKALSASNRLVESTA